MLPLTSEGINPTECALRPFLAAPVRSAGSISDPLPLFGSEGGLEFSCSLNRSYRSWLIKHVRMLQGTHYTFFQTAHLQSIVENVVVPGLRIRESDEEDFEDNPLE